MNYHRALQKQISFYVDELFPKRGITLSLLFEVRVKFRPKDCIEWGKCRYEKALEMG